MSGYRPGSVAAFGGLLIGAEIVAHRQEIEAVAVDFLVVLFVALVVVGAAVASIVLYRLGRREPEPGTEDVAQAPGTPSIVCAAQPDPEPAPQRFPGPALQPGLHDCRRRANGAAPVSQVPPEPSEALRAAQRDEGR